MMVDALYKIILELSGAELAGPIGVAQMAGRSPRWASCRC